VSPATKDRLSGQRLRQTGRAGDEANRRQNRPSDPIELAGVGSGDPLGCGIRAIE
jgi:hypothetical protein